jgi:ATP synthase F1 gamma subunit
MASQRDVKNKIASVKNIQKITRAMEMVAAARLRRAEQRIAALRPYADAIGRMTRQAAAAAGAEALRLPLLREHESQSTAALLLVTGDRGLAGGFNSQIIRAGVRLSADLAEDGMQSTWYAAGRRGVSSLAFRGHELHGSYAGFTDKPAYADARSIADDLMQAYVDGHIDRVVMVYNSYLSPLTQHVTEQTLLPLTGEALVGQDGDTGQEPRSKARPGEDPQAPRAGLHRDFDLPGAGRVRGGLLRGADDGHAQRLGERRRNHHRVHAADEPRPPGGDHPGDHGGCRRGRGTHLAGAGVARCHHQLRT